jgi:phage terminase small subunit
MSKRNGRTYEQRKAAMRKTVVAAIEAKDTETLGDLLTPRQKAFAQEYIRDFNSTQAVGRAGYLTKYPNKVGHQMLNNPSVRAYIDQLLVDRSDTIEVDVNYVVKKITRAIERCDAAGKYNEVLRGAELLAKYLGMFIERTEITGKDGGPIEYEKVKEDADAFTRAIEGLTRRNDIGPTIN